MEVGTREYQKMKERAWGKKINYQHETHLHLMGKTMKLPPAPSSVRDWGQRRDRPRTRLRDQSGCCFHAALLPTWAWGWAAKEGRRLGKFHGHSSDFSMKQKYSNLARKVKEIPKENIHTVLLWVIQQVSTCRCVLNTTSFSFTICCIYSCAVKNKNPADPNPFK